MSKTTKTTAARRKPTARPHEVYARQPHILYVRGAETYLMMVGSGDGEDPQAEGWEHRGVFPTWDAAAVAV